MPGAYAARREEFLEIILIHATHSKQLDMTDRRTHSLNVLAAKVRNGKELDKARTSTVCRHNFCRCHRAGKRSKPQLPRSADHIYIHIRRDDKPRLRRQQPAPPTPAILPCRLRPSSGPYTFPAIAAIASAVVRNESGSFWLNVTSTKQKPPSYSASATLRHFFGAMPRTMAISRFSSIKLNGIFQHGFLPFPDCPPLFFGRAA